MCNVVKQLGVAALAAVVIGGVAVPSAHAQQRVVNPNFQAAPGLALNQARFNFVVTRQAFAQVPLSPFGFNPFPPTVVTRFASVSTASPFFGRGTSILTTQRVVATGFQPGFRVGFQPGFPSRGFQAGFRRGFQVGFQRGFRPGP